MEPEENEALVSLGEYKAWGNISSFFFFSSCFGKNLIELRLNELFSWA